MPTKKTPAVKKPLPRITVRQVKAAYRKTRLAPAVGEMLNDDSTAACALGAIHAAQCSDENQYLWAHRIYGQNYANGFISGFDSTPSFSRAQRYREGRDDGIAARKAVLE